MRNTYTDAAWNTWQGKVLHAFALAENWKGKNPKENTKNEAQWKPKGNNAIKEIIVSVQCSTDSTVRHRVSVSVSAQFTLVIQLQQFWEASAIARTDKEEEEADWQTGRHCGCGCRLNIARRRKNWQTQNKSDKNIIIKWPSEQKRIQNRIKIVNSVHREEKKQKRKWRQKNANFNFVSLSLPLSPTPSPTL